MREQTDTAFPANHRYEYQGPSPYLARSFSKSRVLAERCSKVHLQERQTVAGRERSRKGSQIGPEVPCWSGLVERLLPMNTESSCSAIRMACVEIRTYGSPPRSQSP